MPKQYSGVCDYCHIETTGLIPQRRQNYGKLICQSCEDARMAVHRRSPKVRAKNRAISATIYEQRRAKFLEFKARPCADCGGSFPHYVMEFDHPDRSTKTDTISRMMSRNGFRLTPEVLAEIDKTTLVCANCHRVRTRRQEEAGEWQRGRPRLPDVPQWEPAR